MLLNSEKVESKINHSFHINHLKVSYFSLIHHYLHLWDTGKNLQINRSGLKHCPIIVS